MADATERTCETCRHVLGGEKAPGGGVLTSQRCRYFRAGKYPMLTWTALKNPGKCGEQRAGWEPREDASGVAMDQVLSDTTRMDWLETFYSAANEKEWREFMTVAAERGFRAATDSTRGVPERVMSPSSKGNEGVQR